VRSYKQNLTPNYHFEVRISEDSKVHVATIGGYIVDLYYLGFVRGVVRVVAVV
jgi:hypothetical protein